jgi:hypothetical protein
VCVEREHLLQQDADDLRSWIVAMMPPLPKIWALPLDTPRSSVVVLVVDRTETGASPPTRLTMASMSRTSWRYRR